MLQGWPWQVLPMGDSCFPWFERAFYSHLPKEDFFFPAQKGKCRKMSLSWRKQSAQKGFEEELVFLWVLWCSHPALHPLPACPSRFKDVQAGVDLAHESDDASSVF